MRFLFGLLMIAESAVAQDAGITTLASKLGHQLAGRQMKSVAVLQFTNKQNYDPQVSAHLVDQINQEMVKQAPGIEVASREQSEALLRELRLVDAPEINTKDLETIATRLNVAAIVTGTIDAAGQTVAIDATIFDGKTSYIIGAASAKLDRADLDAFLVERKGPQPGPIIAIPSGMQIDVKMNEKVDAAEARNGKTVSASLENDLVVRNVLLAKKGTEVKLQATSPDGMELHIALTSMTLADQRNVLLSSDQVIKPSTMVRPKAPAEGVPGEINNGTSAAPTNAPAQPKPGEAAQDAWLVFHLNQDAR
jgi:TolB-like protein